MHLSRLQQATYAAKAAYHSVHEPLVECISKGKAHKRYEFGRKVSIAATSRGGWQLAALAHHGHPYDGHTLPPTMEQLVKLAGSEPGLVFADMGCRGHIYEGSVVVHVNHRRRGRIPTSTRRWLKRRNAIEPTIGHLKSGRRLDRNRLKGALGDELNVILSAAGVNFLMIIKALATMPGSPALFWTWLHELLRRRPAAPATSDAH